MPSTEANPLVEGTTKTGFPPKKKVSRAIICNAIKDIEDRHPLRQTASWGKISCCCKLVCCCAKKKKPFKAALRMCMLEELDLFAAEEDLSDPYLVLGYGVNAYYQILASLAKMFFWCFLFSIPMLYIYGTGTYYYGQKSFPISRFFIGNFGGSNMMCKSQRIATGRIELECPKGTVFESSDKAIIGALSNQMTSFTWCNQVAIDKVLEEEKHKNCSAAISTNQRQTFKKELNRKCKKKERCSLSFEHVFDKGGHHTGNECDDEAYLFMQIPCVVPSEKLVERKVMGLGIACLGVFLYLFIFISVEYIKSYQDNMFIDWDVKTISAADYTCEFGITEEMYENFTNKYLDETNPISEIGQFRSYVKDEMEARLTEFPGLGIDGPEGDEAPVKIAVVTFAFDNAEIIKRLTTRGQYIKQQKWKKYIKINDKIVTRLHNSQELLDKMQTPVYCFLTFETEEGKCRCDIYNETVQLEDFAHYKTFLGSEIDMSEASEPTDIIWENRHYSNFQRFVRTIIVCLILFGVLCCSFVLIYTAQKTALAMKQKYPKVACGPLLEEYDKRREAWMRDSINEYIVNTAIEEKGGVALYTGPMQCFCINEKKTKHKKTEFYELKDSDGKSTFKEQICLQYQNDKLFSKILALSITVIVVAVNTIIKKVVVALVAWIGEDTVSQQKATVVKGAFIGQFFNTGFIILIVNANMMEHEPKKFWKIFNGPFYDYMPQWYIDVGLKIIITYTVQGIMPYINVVKETVLAKLKTNLDNGCSGNKFKTKTHTMQLYKGIYTGKEWQIHFKYSDALNISFLAMLYGIGMPIMFPMAMIIISNQRLAERVQVAFNMKQPPAMDDSLSKSVLSILKYGPLCLLFNGFWLLDNRQFFDNVWIYKNKSTENMMSGHHVGIKVNQSSPMLLAGILCFAVVIIQVVVPHAQLKAAGFTMAKEDLDVDEDLPNFFKALTIGEANRLIAENEQMQKEYGFELCESSFIDQLNQTSWPKRSIQGTPWYALMSNPKYVDDFAYLGPHIKDRNNLMRDHDFDSSNNYQQSDVVTILTNLGSIPDYVARKFHLGNNFAVDFMGFMDEYKQQFEENNGIKWQYSNEKLLDRYMTFKRTRESFQREPRDDKEGGSIEMVEK